VNRHGALFALTDMVLVVVMMAIVKMAGATFPSIQLVFLRALVGLVLVLPLVWRYRAEVFNTRRMKGHLLRISCNAVALSCNFAAIAALPLALVTAIGFTRPFIVLALASIVLGETVSRTRWLASGICFVGILIVTQPGSLSWDLGLAAAFGSVLFGSLAVIQTRRLAGEHTVLLMLFYTLGLTVLTAVPAAFVWVSPVPQDLPALLFIGLLAQIGQYCFLRAHQIAEARVLAPLGYLSIVLSTLADYLFFRIVPTAAVALGSAVIVGTALAIERIDGRNRRVRSK
jgi:S-adenosylmethionine uptake transporter